MMTDKQAKKIIKKMVKLHAKGASISELLKNFNEADSHDSRLLLALRTLDKEKDSILPDKDVYHKLLQKTSVTNSDGSRSLFREGDKGRENNFLFNLNNFFMTFNPKVITAVSLVVVLCGVFAFWQLSPKFKNIDDSSQKAENVDLSKYAPATIVAISDVDGVVDSVVNDAVDEALLFDEEELDIYLADAEADALSDLEQLYESYEL